MAESGTALRLATCTFISNAFARAAMALPICPNPSSPIVFSASSSWIRSGAPAQYAQSRLAQLPVRIGERHVPRKQRRHHVFGDRLLVTEAIAYDGGVGKSAEIHRIVTGARNVK